MCNPYGTCRSNLPILCTCNINLPGLNKAATYHVSKGDTKFPCTLHRCACTHTLVTHRGETCVLKDAIYKQSSEPCHPSFLLRTGRENETQLKKKYSKEKSIDQEYQTCTTLP